MVAHPRSFLFSIVRDLSPRSRLSLLVILVKFRKKLKTRVLNRETFLDEPKTDSNSNMMKSDAKEITDSGKK